MLCHSFHQRCLRKILKINWTDHRTNVSVLEESGCFSIETLLIKSQLSWAGHVVRMSDNSIPKQIFYSELSEGNRKIGRQMKHYKDNLKEYMKTCNINFHTWERTAQERSTWRGEIYAGIERLITRRKTESDQRRANRAARLENPDLVQQLPLNNVCHCGKQCRARAGLISHLRTHNVP